MSEKATSAKSGETKVELELNPAAGVDVLGDATPPLLWVGMTREFTRAEATALLALRNEHGTSIVRTVEGAKK